MSSSCERRSIGAEAGTPSASATASEDSAVEAPAGPACAAAEPSATSPASATTTSYGTCRPPACATLARKARHTPVAAATEPATRSALASGDPRATVASCPAIAATCPPGTTGTVGGTTSGTSATSGYQQVFARPAYIRGSSPSARTRAACTAAAGSTPVEPTGSALYRPVASATADRNNENLTRRDRDHCMSTPTGTGSTSLPLPAFGAIGIQRDRRHARRDKE